jgi:hypothetical protein
MMKYSILQSGDIIPISASAAAHAREVAGAKVQLFLGLQCEFTHNEILLACGYPVDIPDPARKCSWDRSLHGQLQDDKVATFLNSTGEVGSTISKSHTISGTEFDHWSRLAKAGQDTVIHSFEYTSPQHDAVVYRGAISFLLWSPFQRTGQSSYFMVRREAYNYNLLQG